MYILIIIMISYFSIDNSLRKIILMSDFNEETNIISKFEAKLIANKFFEEKIELITMYNEYILYKFFNFIL